MGVGDRSSSHKGEVSEVTLGRKDSISLNIQIKAGCLMAILVDTRVHMCVTCALEVEALKAAAPCIVQG